MKTGNKICALFFILISIGAAANAQTQTPDSLGLPGDNLNLYGVLDLFKESKNVEEFEKMLNTPDNKVNNLDLNHDGQTDYIRVKDYGENGIHTLVLQDPISATETQDLAIIEIEQQGNNNVRVQVVGDEDLYGKNYIIEPQDQQQAQQPVVNDTYNQGAPPPPVVYVNVWAWPCVQYVYAPGYVFWSSPWYWGYYPHWWRPWNPIGYYAYWNYMYGYRAYHHRVYVNHIVVAQNIYYVHRQTSPTVHGYIANHTYYGPRVGQKTAPMQNNGIKGPRGNKMVSGNTGGNKVVTGPRNMGGKPNNNANKPVVTNNQPKQQSFAPRQNNGMIKQQQTVPHAMNFNNGGGRGGFRQQQMPHNMNMGGGGGAHMGGGGGRRR